MIERILSPDLLGELIATTGMTQAEAAEYLGVTHSALRLQCRGRTSTPVETVLRIWRIVEGVLGEKTLPSDVPESVRRRREVLDDMKSMRSGTTILRVYPRDLEMALRYRDMFYSDKIELLGNPEE